MDYIGSKRAGWIGYFNANDRIYRVFVITIGTLFRLYDALKAIEKHNYYLNYIMDHMIYQSNSWKLQKRVNVQYWSTHMV